ncbi:MAG: DinB family protein [Methylocystis sp.]|uniref:DinB family protein n=1 Tax=Methylocystis sp. TaxID=1911079 RepID=UPI003D14EDE3
MIRPIFAQTMARYNRWQNAGLYAAADRLSDEDRRKDRGAFFKSIHATLSHLLWADHMWLSRISDAPPPSTPLAQSVSYCEDWETLKRRRIACDELLIAWADGVTDAWLTGDLVWRSGVLKAEVARPKGLVVSHIFNHQTHHRGQVHAMLTAAGAGPPDTDLILMEPLTA